MSFEKDDLPFSQRNGLAPIPPQLKLGEVSAELRRLVDYCIQREIENVSRHGYDHAFFDDKWKVVATDLHVKFFNSPVSTFENNCYRITKSLEDFIKRADMGHLFDLVEFLIRHPQCSNTLTVELSDAFGRARAAYRIIDKKIIAIGTEEQAVAFQAAIVAAETGGAAAARHHLLASGTELRNGNWADSIRESIHAVEAMARRIPPDSNTLGPALKTLERKGYLHGSLKSGFDKLYGYTNDEDGIRHALSEAKVQVDEVDALFMLGACASFVSYLIGKETAFSETSSN